MDPLTLVALVLFVAMVVCWLALPGGTTTNTAAASELEPAPMVSTQ